jgi:hypothetical protein
VPIRAQTPADHGVDCSLHPLGRCGTLLAGDERRWVELEDDWDVERCGCRVEDCPHLAHRTHPHPEYIDRCPRLQSADRALEADEERHAACNPGRSRSLGVLLAEPDRLAPPLDQLACPVRRTV